MLPAGVGLVPPGPGGAGLPGLLPRVDGVGPTRPGWPDVPLGTTEPPRWPAPAEPVGVLRIGAGGLTVKPDTLVTTSPSGFVTFTSRTPMAAAVSIVIATESCVDARTVVEFTVMPPPNEALAPGWKLEPVTETVRLVPAEPAFGDTLVIVGTAGRVTVVVADVPSAKFALSVKTDPPLNGVGLRSDANT